VSKSSTATRRAPILFVCVVLGVAGVAHADNIDPSNKFAWGENVGWINAGPSVSGSPGMQIDDFEVAGWMWGENLGWISLSCENDGSCSTTEYGVLHDGAGTLSGYAWSENAGWINFSPATAGVFVDPATGEFSGHAWGENVGWIAFSWAGAHPGRLVTTWRCDPAPAPPADTPELTLEKMGADTALHWTTVTGATGYDVVYGELGTLRTSPAPFEDATLGCPGDNDTGSGLIFQGTPSPGDGFWFLVRGVNCGGAGTYDSIGSGQVAPRDAAIAAGGGCP
jgi:hypothetical protein